MPLVAAIVSNVHTSFNERMRIQVIHRNVILVHHLLAIKVVIVFWSIVIISLFIIILENIYILLMHHLLLVNLADFLIVVVVIIIVLILILILILNFVDLVFVRVDLDILLLLDGDLWLGYFLIILIYQLVGSLHVYLGNDRVDLKANFLDKVWQIRLWLVRIPYQLSDDVSELVLLLL